MMDPRTESLLQTLRALPAETLSLTMRSVRGQAERTFTGPLLADYAVAAGFIRERTADGAISDGYFVVTAADGMRVTVSLAEVVPGTSTKQVILATTQDGSALDVGARLVLPEFPGLAGRSVLGVASIEFHHFERSTRAEPTSAITLAGLLDRSGACDLAALGADALVEVETAAGTGHQGEPLPPRRYAGVPVYRLLDEAGIQLDPAVHEDFLQNIVVATGADGQSSVIAGGEIEPRFMNGTAIVAVLRDGKPLGPDEGPARLVVPWDLKPGRWARNLVRLELRRA